MYKHQRLRGDYGPARYRGDPGLLDIFGKVTGVVGNILPGPLGAVAKVASQALTPRPSTTRPSPTAIPRPQTTMTGISIGGASGIRVGRETTTASGFYAQGVSPGGGGSDGCPKGYKLNKTGYFLRSGQFIPPESKCVRIRTRNFANGKALTKAISRAGGFERMVRRNRKNLRKLSKI